jgi:hypothetical protein
LFRFVCNLAFFRFTQFVCFLILAFFQFGEIIGQQLPELKEDVETTRLKAAEAVAVAADAAPENESPFDDEDTRAFYEDFPVLRASVPACMFGDKAVAAAEKTTDGDAAAVSVASTVVERLNLEDDAGAEGDGGMGAGVPTALDNLLARLPKCVSKVRVQKSFVDKSLILISFSGFGRRLVH